ncbi:MAG: glycosyltransferase family 9 protein [Prevotellaceae bacterium]|nr:glycosyltransferase family 9 protein [Prevotellaceae bacterium]
MRVEHILIIRFSALGDVVMTVPVVYSLAMQYPHVRITMLSREFARPLFENMPPNVGFMSADLKHEYYGMKGLNALYRRLTAKNFTAIADFHSVLRSDYLRMRFNIDRYKVAHIDKHRSGRRQLVSTDSKKLVQQPTSFQNYLDVLERLGYPVKPDFKSIFPSEGGDLSLLPEIFREKKSGDLWIGIAPFAAHEGKIYPPRLMEQVITKVIARYPHCRLFLFGGGDNEKAVFKEWCGKYPECVSASEQLGGFGNELILMSHLDLMISMDSANMHLASIVGTTVVSIWGATHPFAGFMGWGQSIDNAVQIDLPCRPCSIYGNKPCMRGDYSCMKNISPEQIVERVEIALHKVAVQHNA